jgi:hypothetical protein
LEAEEDDDREQAENQQGAHVAAATTAGTTAAALHLEIWILIFGQRKLPVLNERHNGCARFVYGKGSW